jgi:hypothetical protein
MCVEKFATVSDSSPRKPTIVVLGGQPRSSTSEPTVILTVWKQLDHRAERKLAEVLNTAG